MTQSIAGGALAQIAGSVIALQDEMSAVRRGTGNELTAAAEDVLARAGALNEQIATLSDQDQERLWITVERVNGVGRVIADFTEYVEEYGWTGSTPRFELELTDDARKRLIESDLRCPEGDAQVGEAERADSGTRVQPCVGEKGEMSATVLALRISFVAGVVFLTSQFLPPGLGVIAGFAIGLGLLSMSGKFES